MQRIIFVTLIFLVSTVELSLRAEDPFEFFVLTNENQTITVFSMSRYVLIHDWDYLESAAFDTVKAFDRKTVVIIYRTDPYGVDEVVNRDLVFNGYLFKSLEVKIKRYIGKIFYKGTPPRLKNFDSKKTNFDFYRSSR